MAQGADLVGFDDHWPLLREEAEELVRQFRRLLFGKIVAAVLMT
jgi:hypothetical protein